jgi:hypothetical protein
MLTTHPDLVPWSWMSRSYKSSPPSASIRVMWECFTLLLCRKVSVASPSKEWVLRTRGFKSHLKHVSVFALRCLMWTEKFYQPPNSWKFSCGHRSSLKKKIKKKQKKKKKVFFVLGIEYANTVYMNFVLHLLRKQQTIRFNDSQMAGIPVRFRKIQIHSFNLWSTKRKWRYSSGSHYIQRGETVTFTATKVPRPYSLALLVKIRWIESKAFVSVEGRVMRREDDQGRTAFDHNFNKFLHKSWSVKFGDFLMLTLGEVLSCHLSAITSIVCRFQSEARNSCYK